MFTPKMLQRLLMNVKRKLKIVTNFLLTYQPIRATGSIPRVPSSAAAPALVSSTLRTA